MLRERGETFDPAELTDLIEEARTDFYREQNSQANDD
jgi:hypothetical protein